ncbi:hypothetical protein [Xanthomonas phaseoli]|uniref:Uncharacterized protein n=2 Tax=Xanthomonas TaxID=338 RepID=A0A8I1XKR8_XANMN|nr:hypothetical protein [Xanthomonas phaseoli]RWU13977.1 hypothetical protein XANMN_19720 [Xanthomonas phaseoli pv. manihotis str. CIO151]KUF35630.1 hypothetical protein AO826_20280 [Xanthomonas phaseoli pv. manihotis]MBO9722542.1 hypothetical protein [Xanthomonas phaseoli pv. manihotis]MBO9757960.1 hypothetical protein [Xanthomonas phaseoli pv. manihotis]MBO9761014.1 hypothetical protein [Xanthomonas phaseoli pv. manihotis]
MIERVHAHVQLTDTYDLRATLAGREVALFAGHRAPQRRLDQILSTYYTLALRHLPDFTPDEWAALAAIFDNDADSHDGVVKDHVTKLFGLGFNLVIW